MPSRVTALLAFVTIIGASTAATASILSYSSTVVEIPAPPDATTGHLESDKRIRAFGEQQHLTLAHDVAVDINAPGTSPTGGVPHLSLGSITTGTVIDSYLLHYDDTGTPDDPVHITGSITFSVDVLGIEVQQPSLNATDTYPGLPTTIYATTDLARGLELNGGAGADIITLSADRRTISLDLHNVSRSDDIRVITASTVPEPSTFIMVATGCVGFIAWRWRRQATFVTGVAVSRR
jgi:hypothetical protein